MIIAIHQPDYIPYPGYFYKIAQSDCFVFLDDAQYSNEGFSNWNRIKSPQGELRLKAPVQQTLGNLIQEVKTRDYLGWKQKHLKTLWMNYKRAKYFEPVYSDFESILLPEYENIADMNIAIIQLFCRKLGITKRFERSSSLGITTLKEERILDICTLLKGSVYLSGKGARVYQDSGHFLESGIELRYTDYHSIIYEQLWGEFLPDLSIIDYLFNHGYDWDSIKVQIRGRNRGS
ncbi:WbqC family protein [Anaerocolumna aminovalerica]|uniref:WbqC family protein n=1 Tax=Anaerocolumna aminovalerica TaxID=1527 RepID=UPI000BE47D0E|nr:WbqC family protein [Anaerocolumna aminovalerica]